MPSLRSDLCQNSNSKFVRKLHIFKVAKFAANLKYHSKYSTRIVRYDSTGWILWGVTVRSVYLPINPMSLRRGRERIS